MRLYFNFNHMKKLLSALSVLVFLFGTARADEGMWTLPQIGSINIQEMQARGLKLSAEDIYSLNNSSLKDAIVMFDGGCSGELISDKGLILTNHHCGYDAIQSHSTVEHDYLKDGFWAMSFEEEIPTPGLTVQFVKEFKDVTAQIAPKSKKAMTEAERNEKIDANVKKLLKKENKKAQKKYPNSECFIESFYGGNQFILVVMQEFNDVRMVGTPPSSIGKFGGDTDNWMWPRHTGDFSLFRVYTDKNGNPAEYSKDNVPMKPAEHLKVSLKGYDEGDYAMIIGFPGSTNRFMTSWELAMRTDVTNALRIFIRGVRQDILMEDMLADPKVKIQYASKYAGSSNYWKNAIGQNEALARMNVKADKEKREKEFTEWVNSDSDRFAEYGDALPLIESSVEALRPYTTAYYYIVEAILRSCEMINFAGWTESILETGNTEPAEQFYKDYSFETDRKVTEAMFKLIYDNLDKQYQPEIFLSLIGDYGSPEALADAVFDTSIYGSQEAFMSYVQSGDKESYKNDKAYILGRAFANKINSLVSSEEYTSAALDLEKGTRLFIKGIMEKDAGVKNYAPDANFTMRLTYGNIKPYSPRDGVMYEYYTTLDGVIDKEDLSNPEEFTVPERLKELHASKDYGQYANEKGELPVAFIADLDITGGNSGSPVMNADGELIGVAFDANWEGMSGDILFDENLQRCVNLDIRYALFVIDKFAGCTRLIEEMDIVK